MAQKTTGANVDELMKAFDTDEEKIEKRIGILDKLQMPTPESGGINVRLLWSKDDQGTPIVVMKRENAKFRGGIAYFVTVELIDSPGEKQMSLNKSVLSSMLAAAKEKKITLDDMVGKAATITAQYYTAAPISLRKDPQTGRGRQCVKCGGKGCAFCTVTGSGQDAGIATGLQPPTVYNYRLRDDLNQVVDNKGANIGQQF